MYFICKVIITFVDKDMYERKLYVGLYVNNVIDFKVDLQNEVQGNRIISQSKLVS